jgi:hypothetical protein
MEPGGLREAGREKKPVVRDPHDQPFPLPVTITKLRLLALLTLFAAFFIGAEYGALSGIASAFVFAIPLTLGMTPLLGSCTKAATFLSENSGIIAALAQQEILTGDPDYALSRIKESRYDTSKGHSPRYIRMRITPPRRTRYVPMLPTGNAEVSVVNPQTGATETVLADKTGRGCALPAEKILYGYDVKNRCLVGKAIEAGPWCIMDLLEKEALPALLERIWLSLPRFLKEDFGRQLLRDVIQFSTFKYSVGPGFPVSAAGAATFPMVPTGGPSIGFFRQVERLIMAQGWQKGSNSPMINGRSVIQVAMSREAIEWAIVERKKELGLTLDSRIYVDDGTFGKTVIYEGIQFIELETPTRGYLRQTGADAFEFVEIDPTITVLAGGEGFWPEPNPEYYSAHVLDGGVSYRVLEPAFIIHPNAMERQAMGAPPNVKGKTFNRAFDFTVNPIPDYELADKGCNMDQFWFGYRALHAYAARPINPELMTAILFLSPTNRYSITDPWFDEGTALAQPVSLAALNDPRATTCVPCTADANNGALDPTNPTCADLFPVNGAGLIRFRQSTLDVEEGAGNLTIVVERVGGSVGAAGVTITITEGTATSPENFDADTGTYWTGSGPTFTRALAWADGVSGPVTVLVPIVEAAGDDNGKVFTGALGSATGVAVIDATRDDVTVTILDADNA